MEARVMYEFEPVLFSSIVIMNRLCHIAYTTSKSEAFVKHGNKALKHADTIVFADYVWIICVNTPIVHIILDVEECNWRIDINNDDQETQRQAELFHVLSYGFNNILKGWRSVDYVEQMHWIVNIWWEVTEDGDSEVENVVLENTIMDEEENVVDLEFG